MNTFRTAHIGSELAGYRLEELAGRGGMGVVYRAHDLALDRSVALKLLALELTGNADFRERFLVESRLAASLDHPNVVPIYDAGQVEDQLYIAMRYVSGTDLRALLAQSARLEPARAIAICSQIAEALDSAHARGLVHRDVKPSNVLLDEREHAYLADFGLTKRLAGQEAPGFESGLSLGTPAYVAPEQIAGEDVDGRADQYSLGCLLFECLSGRPPFPRSSEAAVLFAHLEEEPPVFPGLEGVLHRALAKSPEERYGSCRELVEAAREALGLAEPRRARWPLALVGVGATLIGAALLAFFLVRGGSAQPSITLGGNAVAAIDPGTNRINQEIPVGARPGAIAFGSGSLWVANVEDRTVARIDPAAGQVVRYLTVGDTPTALAASGGGIWVVGSSPNRPSVSVRRIDPEFDVPVPVTRIPSVVPGDEGSIAARGKAIWVAPSFGFLSRLDSKTRGVLRRIDPNASPSSIAVGANALWITDLNADTVTRVDPSGALTPIPVDHGPTGIAVGAGAVWVADSLDGTVARIDPGKRRVTARIPVGEGPEGVAVGAGSVWVANSRDGTVTRIDPATGSSTAVIDVGGSPQKIVVAGGRVWVTVQPRAVEAARVPASAGTVRVNAVNDFGNEDYDSLDPALVLGNWSPLLYATCAKLLNYPDKPAPVGSQLVPEVAQSLPTRSPDGKTYTFTIRKGFRFSPPSNQAVTARTFKYTIERSLSPKMQTYYATLFGDIVGAKAYIAGKASHVAGVVARANRLVIRLRRPNPDLLTRLAMPAFCAVPIGTPLDPKGVPAIPSAGPYFVALYTPGQGAVLERNPNYAGTRPRRLDRIELTFGVSGETTVADIESGAVDYALGDVPVPPGDVGRLAALYGPDSPAARSGGQRFFSNPRQAVHFLLLNTDRPLFRDLKLRRAVNYAIDRRALASVGPPFASSGRPTDQYLPPGLPGFRDVSIYPFTPDLAAARRLAGGKKRVAVLYTCKESTCVQLARIVRENLRSIGIETKIKAFPFRSLIQKYSVQGEPYDLALANWIVDYPDPADGLNVPLRELGFDDRRYIRRLEGAARLSGPRRYLEYAKLDPAIARNAAPWVVYANSVRHDFFSARVGCQTYQPIYGFDLGALCIRRS